MNPNSSSPLSPSRWAPLIHAPLTPEDTATTSSGGSELDSHSGFGSGSEPESESEPEPDSVSTPMARLTRDGESEEAEEGFDEVDGDGFAVRVPIPSSSSIPNSSDAVEYSKDPKVEIFDDVSSISNPSSMEEDFDEVDGDGFAVRVPVPSPTSDAKVEVFDDGRSFYNPSSVGEDFDEVDGDGFAVRAPILVNENSDLNPTASFNDGVLEQNSSLDEYFEAEASDEDGSSSVARVARVKLSEGGEAKRLESDLGERDESSNSDGDLGENFSLKEGVESAGDGAADTPEKGLEEIVSIVEEEDLNENHNAENNAEKNGEDSCFSENHRQGGSYEYELDDYRDEIGKENGNVDALTEKDQISGDDSEHMKPLEVKPNTTETAKDEIEEACKHKEFKAFADAIAGSEQNHTVDVEIGYVVVESEKSENFASKLDCGKATKSTKALNEVSNSPIESGLPEKFADNFDAINETHTSLTEDEKSQSEIVSIEAKPKESKPNSVENIDFFVDSFNTSSNENENESDEEGRELLNSASLLELFKAVAFSTNIKNTITTSDTTSVLPVQYPIGLGSSIPPLEPTQPRQPQPIFFITPNLSIPSKTNNMTDEEKKLHEKFELIRIKFLRIVHRLGYSSEDIVVASALYRLALFKDLKYWNFSSQNAVKQAIELEKVEKNKLDFSCNILVIGKAGVGKSATINSIFDEEKCLTSPFTAGTTSVQKIEGVVDGIKVQVLDTPGLGTSLSEQASNIKVLSSLKKHMKKCPPDAILYVDRLDTQTLVHDDFPLFRSITRILGPSIWSNAIIALTHAATAPPEGRNGLTLPYEAFIDQRSHVLQMSIWQAVGDMMRGKVMNPVVLVENHGSCRRNIEGQRVLPNGSRWRSELLLSCYSKKILSEANLLYKARDSVLQKLFRFQSLPITHFLSSLLESKPHPKGEGLDIDLDDYSEADDEEEDEYDQLPPFRPLTKSQIAKLSEEQKRAYFDEYDYRAKLLQKKQWKEEITRLKEIKKRLKNGNNNNNPEDLDDAPDTVQASVHDLPLPPSFDSDYPVYRYRSMEPTSQLFTRPLLNPSGWDHDRGFDWVSVEKLLTIAQQYPGEISITLKKDKKDFTLNIDSLLSATHGDSGSSLASFDVQTINNQLTYIFKGETRLKNLKKNKTTVGVLATLMGDKVAAGVKLEDQVSIRKRTKLGLSMGAVRAGGDVAYGADLEATLMKKDCPMGEALATLGLSLIRYRKNLSYKGILQSEVSFGRDLKMSIHVGLSNNKTGQITIKTSSSEQLQIALIGLVPFAISVFRKIWTRGSSSDERHGFYFPSIYRFTNYLGFRIN